MTEPRSEQLTLVWDTEITRHADNTVTLRASKPLHRMSTRQAAKLLGCSEWTVQKLFQRGVLTGWKPGGLVKRKDGRASNSAIVLDAAALLEYKQSVSRAGVF